jgi:hypothetical protein
VGDGVCSRQDVLQEDSARLLRHTCARAPDAKTSELWNFVP